MTRTIATLIAALGLAACGGNGGTKETTASKEREVRKLDPNPPMSAGDIDSIVKETRDRNASRGGGAVAPPAENASNTTN